MNLKKAAIRLAYSEEHEIIRKGVISLLSAYEEFTIDIEAEDADELFHKLSQTDNVPDVCLIGLNLPFKSGFDVLKKIKPKWPCIKILIFSFYGDESAIIQAFKFGANGYVRRNCSIDTLKEALISVHQQSYYLSQLTHDSLQYILQDECLYPILTKKESEFLIHCCEDKTYKEIAVSMHLSARTVESYRDILFKKLNVNTRVGLVMYAIKAGVISPF
jgi:two-component system, NarL family, invasion response regulator UvrY